MNKLLQSLLRRHRPDVDALSAHLDGRLAAREAEAIDAHIAGCAACSSAIDGLRVVRTALQAMPEVTHPRSFRLRGADVERAPMRVGGGGGGQAMRLMPVLSGVAAAVFIVAVGADLLSDGSRSGLKSADTANVMSVPQLAAAPTRNSATSSESAADSAGTTSATAEPPAASAYAGEPTIPDAVAPGLAATPSARAAGAFAPEPGTPPGTEGTSGNKSTIPSPTPELSAASRRPTSSGDVDGLRVVEVVAAVVAVVAAAAAVGWRKRSRGERP